MTEFYPLTHTNLSAGDELFINLAVLASDFFHLSIATNHRLPTGSILMDTLLSTTLYQADICPLHPFFFFPLVHPVAKQIFITFPFFPRLTAFTGLLNPILKFTEIAPIVFIPPSPMNSIINLQNSSKQAWHEPSVTHHTTSSISQNTITSFEFFCFLHRKEQLHRSVDSESLLFN